MEPVAVAATRREPVAAVVRRRTEPVAVIIPTLNEAAAIGAVIAEIPRTIARQIIVADSGSRDGTPEVATPRRRAGRCVGASAATVVPARPAPRRPIRRARCWCFSTATARTAATCWTTLVRPILDGTQDFVIASRTRGVREPGSMSWHQVLAGRLAGWGMRALYGVRYSDMCAYRAIRRDALARLDMREMTYGWNLEMQMKAARRGLRILEVPMPYRCRAGGESKVAGSLRGTLRAATRIVATFVRVATSAGIPP